MGTKLSHSVFFFDQSHNLHGPAPCGLRAFIYAPEALMRFRTAMLILAILLFAGIVALNVEEFTRISVLSLGFTTVQVSLGLVMLLLLTATLVIFLASTLYQQSRHVLEARTHTRELNAQRDLADKAEASRFTELRTYLEAQAVAAQQRDAAFGAVMADRMAHQQQVLLTRIDQTDNTVAAYLGQMEDKLLHSHAGSSAAPVALDTRNTTFR